MAKCVWYVSVKVSLNLHKGFFRQKIEAESNNACSYFLMFVWKKLILEVGINLVFAKRVLGKCNLPLKVFDKGSLRPV